MLVASVARRLASTAPLPRDARFARITDADVRVFESIVGCDNVKRGEEEMAPFNADWMRQYNGSAPCAVLPSTAEECSALLRHCVEKKIAVVPQAGNTGLVGGSVPVFDELVLSTKRMKKKMELNETSGILTCSSGWVLQDLEERIADKGYTMPFDLGAKGSCLIGGNISTCAGGIRLLRYGSLHAHLLGCEVVIPDAQGSILKLGGALRKDNTSLHSHHLFVGAEGQLGVISEVTMTVVARPTSVQSAMLGVSSFDACRRVLALARKRLGEVLSSFEMMDVETMDVIEECLSLRPVLSGRPRFTLLIEVSGSDARHDSEKMSTFLEECIETGLAEDGVQASSAEESAAMWKLREASPLAMAKKGYLWKYDVSLPLDHFYRLTEETRKRVGSLATAVVTYGHVGDGNSHLNITTHGYNKQLADCIYPWLYEWVVSHGGSVSAEHGVGQMKREYARIGKSAGELALARAVKKTFDPHGIMSPYKML